MNSMLANGTKLVLLTQEDSIWKRIFGLDLQTLFDLSITLIAMLVLFCILSYFLFNPVRDLLNKRKELIAKDMSDAKTQKAEAISYKEEYDSKLKEIKHEADELMSSARKKAQKQETEIVNEAKEEAIRIKSRAEREAELAKSKMRDGLKQEMITVATAMAGKMVSVSMDDSKQNDLLETTLKEMGEETWQN